MKCIVASQLDIAGMNVYRFLADAFNFKEIGEFDGKPKYIFKDVLLVAINSSLLEANINLDVEYYVFASKHKSEAGIKTLTVHAPGNLTSKALFGGRPRSLSYANADAMKIALAELKKMRDKKNMEYLVSFEATHHGPTELSRPVLFVEVGSTKREWNDQRAIEIVAEACYKAATNKKCFTKALGVGGTHYAPLHTKIALKTEIAIGHIIPSYAIDELSFEVFEQAIRKSNAEFILADWKGMKSKHRKKIKEYASQLDIEIKKAKDFI